MERLNDIFGRTPPHRQQNMEHHQDPSSQGQEITPSRYFSREQTSHLGSGSRSSQTHYQHKIPQRVRYEQGKYSQQDAYSAYSRQQSPARGISDQQGLKHQVDIDGHTQHEEDFVPGRDRSRGSTGITSADSVDVYSTMAGSDVREEWDDDTGDMLYGDWEDDGNDTNLRFNPQVVGTAVHERNSIYPAPARAIVLLSREIYRGLLMKTQGLKRGIIQEIITSSQYNMGRISLHHRKFSVQSV